MKNIILKYQLALTMIIISTALACNNTPQEQNNQSPVVAASELVLTDAQKENAGIATDSIRKVQISPSVILRGRIVLSPEYDVTVHSPVEGFVKGLKWMPGQKVTKGQLLASIEDMKIIQLQQDFLAAKMASYYTAKEFDRQKELYNSKATSEKVLLQAEEANVQKTTEMYSLMEKLRLININPDAVNEKNIQRAIKLFAPVSGYIKSVDVNNGKFVQPNEPLFKISDEKGQFIMLKALEKDLEFISEGKAVHAYSNTQPANKLNGTITQVNRVIQSDGSFDVYVKLNTGNQTLMEGSFFNVEISAPARAVYVLQEEAVLGFEGKKYIFTADGDDKNYHFREVETGFTTDKFTEIINAEAFLSEKIVTKGAYTLLMKLKNVEE